MHASAWQSSFRCVYCCYSTSVQRSDQAANEDLVRESNYERSLVYGALLSCSFVPSRLTLHLSHPTLGIPEFNRFSTFRDLILG